MATPTITAECVSITLTSNSASVVTIHFGSQTASVRIFPLNAKNAQGCGFRKIAGDAPIVLGASIYGIRDIVY